MTKQLTITPKILAVLLVVVFGAVRDAAVLEVSPLIVIKW